MQEYTKHKECSPEETIFRIRALLKDAGVFPVLKWTPDEFSGVCSNRVYLYPVYGLGTNGKGTNELYAEASAFAELAERIQNNIIHIKVFGPQESPYPGTPHYPDEKDMPIDELIAQKDRFLESLFESIGYETAAEQKIFLQKISKAYYSKEDGMIPVIPFADIVSERVVWLPGAVITAFCGSNGMCAGNSMEEALVQGFAEVLERYAQARIIKEGLTPPEIPIEELQQYSLWQLILEIEAKGQYKVSIRDCSLGEDLPVAAVVITDMKKGTFGVKFGCHPSFPISVERTLTEALQGKNLEVFTSTNALAGDELVLNYNNYPNTTKTGDGYYPVSFLGAEASWSHKPWTVWSGSSNREYLDKLLNLIRGKGFAPLIRDASHLGFPSYFIVVPGMSEMFERSRLKLRDIFTTAKVRDAFRHFPDISPEEEEMLLRLILFKEGSVIENGLDIISGLFFKGELFTADRVGACLALKTGRYSVAARLFGKASFLSKNEEDRQYLRAASEYARMLGCGADRIDAVNALGILFGEELTARLKEETEDMQEILQKVFPKIDCYNCETCGLAGVHCEYPEAAVILQKLNKALETGNVSQEGLLAALKA